MDLLHNPGDWFKLSYLIFAFCSALFLGALKGLLVGPIVGLILIAGNVGVILGLLPAHVVWTVYTLVKINRLDTPLKVAILLGLPALFGLWLGLSIGGSVLVGLGYGFFTPWVSTFEAFRHENETKKYVHIVVDGTWETIKGSCTVVRDFADLCYHSYPICLKELRESPDSNEFQTLRFIHVPACIVAGLMGLMVEVPLYTAIAVVKSPYMLFKGWFRLIHDLISREGPFLETACIPIAGLTILVWPIVVVGSVILAAFSSIFVGLHASVIVYQERSFRRGVAYVIAMVAEFDEYTNDWLYLREGSIFPKPQYRKKSVSRTQSSVGANQVAGVISSSVSSEAPAMLVPSLAHSRSVRETIQEVKVVQIWGNMMKSCEIRGKELLDANVITPADLYEWLKAKNSNEAVIIDVGLPCYSLLQFLLHSIELNSSGLVLLDNFEIKAIALEEGEVRFLEKVVLFGSNTQRMEAWENGSLTPKDALRAAQIQGLSRRMTGMVRSVSKFPTHRRRFRQVVKDLMAYYLEKENSNRPFSMRSTASIENV
ncbi:uncharacterized membrane protein At3g27390 isoform X2 [Humulus lupulus]|uniref:uncharacterized membrane protein At3g27390 isoform X2 n=1 Tax=Humulus lupulus TaxID=3486 RepID=UPI002B4071E5|nr:uncharacterized membrane protein At3g27390 isoform X2 [Humulus lupulus]